MLATFFADNLVGYFSKAPLPKLHLANDFKKTMKATNSNVLMFNLKPPLNSKDLNFPDHELTSRNLTFLRSKGYSDNEIKSALIKKTDDFAYAKAIKSGYTLDEIAVFLDKKCSPDPSPSSESPVSKQ